MKYIIKRTERFEDAEFIQFVQASGFFGSMETARRFETREDAEDYIDTEKTDPKYDRAYMGECTFTVEEVKA